MEAHCQNEGVVQGPRIKRIEHTLQCRLWQRTDKIKRSFLESASGLKRFVSFR